MASTPSPSLDAQLSYSSHLQMRPGPWPINPIQTTKDRHRRSDSHPTSDRQVELADGDAAFPIGEHPPALHKETVTVTYRHGACPPLTLTSRAAPLSGFAVRCDTGDPTGNLCPFFVDHHYQFPDSTFQHLRPCQPIRYQLAFAAPTSSTEGTRSPSSSTSHTGAQQPAALIFCG